MSTQLLPISVTILTKNSEKHLPNVLHALKDFDEVLVYDTGSQDSTLDIARSHSNVTIKQGPFEGFGHTHNAATALTRHDWVLSIDSDEIATPELCEEIANLRLDESTVYSPWRKNTYNGRWIRWCGWYPDRQIKLYNRTRTQFSQAQVHEAIQSDGMHIVELQSPVLHYPYDTTADFLAKMQSYSELFAKQYAGKRKSSLTRAITRGTWTFFKSYILKKGILGGREGFIISWYNANTAFYKYLKLMEYNRKSKH